MSARQARGRTRGGGRDARRAARAKTTGPTIPYITRKVPVYELLDDEGLTLIEHNADTILEEIGLDFRDDADALVLWKEAGASIDGERVRFPKGLCRTLIQESAPAEFTQHARNPERSVQIGGNHLVLVPAYGPPFIRNLEEGRRYATIEDFQNFVKARLHEPVPAPLRRHRLRARGPARQQAPPGHGVQPHALERQALHGLGDGARARPGHRRNGEDPVW